MTAEHVLTLAQGTKAGNITRIDLKMMHQHRLVNTAQHHQEKAKKEVSSTRSLHRTIWTTYSSSADNNSTDSEDLKISVSNVLTCQNQKWPPYNQ